MAGPPRLAGPDGMNDGTPPGERPKRPADGHARTGTWTGFLRARIEEERRGALAAAGDGWWEPSEPDAPRYGVIVGDRVIAPVFTGRGRAADEEVTFHLLRNQPGRTLDDLDAKDELLDLLDQTAEGPLAARLLDIVKKFAAPFHDHPECPEAP
ncbi:DUF6221 family protein [Streptomyces sp. NPDC004267]|uniref:DUF6221 family protein n=1 Tax=Streptomyces sp. NPDC004267 TaxID=3364694 RepID=UPI00368F2434